MKETAVKICGIKDVKNALYSIEAGASYIGLVFCDTSKRNVDIGIAREIAAEVDAAGCMPVAVLVNQTLSEVYEICEETGIRTLQFHGSKSLENILNVDKSMSRIVAVKTSPDGSFDYPSRVILEHLNAERDFILYDSIHPGSGLSFSHDAFTPVKSFRTFIAGGLNMSNVSDVIRKIKPYGVDVSSSVESSPGVKDVLKIKNFINQVKICQKNNE